MKKNMFGILIFLSLVYSAVASESCEYPITAYDESQGRNLELCLDLKVEGEWAYNPKGSGAPDMRRPIFAVENSDCWFPEKFIVSASLHTRDEICKILGGEHKTGEDLVYHNRSEKMVAFNLKEKRWVVLERQHQFYLSVLGCKQ